MTDKRNDVFHTVSALALVGLFAAFTGPAFGAESGVHLRKIRLMHAVVKGKRTVPPYPTAIGATTGPMGKLSCATNADISKLDSDTIFRVETASRYFDLSKVCENDYDNASGFDAFTAKPPSYAFSNWDNLRVGEPVIVRILKQTAHLSVSECERYGLLSKSAAQLAFNPFSQRGQRVYRSHCIYAVPEAYVKIKRPSYMRWGYPDAYSRTGREHTDIWTFRVIGSGPRSRAKTTPIGSGYSASLKPLF